VGATELPCQGRAPSALPPTHMHLKELRHMRALSHHHYVDTANTPHPQLVGIPRCCTAHAIIAEPQARTASAP